MSFVSRALWLTASLALVQLGSCGSSGSEDAALPSGGTAGSGAGGCTACNDGSVLDVGRPDTGVDAIAPQHAVCALSCAVDSATACAGTGGTSGTGSGTGGTSGTGSGTGGTSGTGSGTGGTSGNGGTSGASAAGASTGGSSADASATGGTAGSAGIPSDASASPDAPGTGGASSGTGGAGAAGGVDAGASLSACVPVLSDGGELQASCEVVGAGLAGAPCLSTLDCAPTFACVGDASGGLCRPYCCGGTASCADEGTYCAERPLRTRAGYTSFDVPVCVPADDCSLVDPYPCPVGVTCTCPAGRACTLVRENGSTACVVPGSGGLDAPCPCAPGFLCSKASDTCKRICTTEPDNCPGQSACQAASPPLPMGFGVCVGAVGDAG